MQDRPRGRAPTTRVAGRTAVDCDPMRPIIGLTAQPKESISAGNTLDSHVLGHTYTDSVLRAGGLPVLLVPVPDDDIPALVDGIDGLVLTGGGDVDPTRYGEPNNGLADRINFDRDEFELELVRHAMERKLPTLAICRGIQVVNVALGGTLIQDIPSEIGSLTHDRIGEDAYVSHQAVKIEPGCVIAEIVGDTELLVNSIHHQAIRDLGDGLIPVAWAEDGIIEAVQHEDPEWRLIAVQWHPEYLRQRDDEASLAIFRALVDAATRAAV